MEPFAVPLLIQSRLYGACPSWWESVVCCCILTVPTPPVFSYHTNLVVDEGSGAAAVWRNAAIAFVMMALVRFLHAAEGGVFGFQCYDQ